MYESAIRGAEQQIRDRLPFIVDAQIALALGVIVQDVDPKTGEPRIYSEPPDAKAGQYLMDRLMGKPTERKEVDLNAQAMVQLVPWVASDDGSS